MEFGPFLLSYLGLSVYIITGKEVSAAFSSSSIKAVVDLLS